ncbi:MAG TPA: DUF1330 domain-containing protein [Solirubrobacterales bacterium]|nr:DUF1330 domain-containing protein [Solirubrobacterales bacterium]
MAEPAEAEQLDKEAFAEFLERSRSGDDGPVVMLNLLALKPDGGRERYMEYGAAVAPILEGIGGRPLYTAQGGRALIGDERAWDLVLLVEYPSRAAFLEMIGSPEYQAIAHLRTEAITASELHPLELAG